MHTKLSKHQYTALFSRVRGNVFNISTVAVELLDKMRSERDTEMIGIAGSIKEPIVTMKNQL